LAGFFIRHFAYKDKYKDEILPGEQPAISMT